MKHFKNYFLLITVTISFTSAISAQESSSADLISNQQRVPVLTDTANFEKLRAHLINLHSLLREDPENAATIAKMMQQLCPVYRNMQSSEENKEIRQFWDAFDDLKSDDSINYQFLKKITEMYKHEELAIKDPFGAVFHGVLSGNHIFEPNGASIAEQELWSEISDSEEVITESLENSITKVFSTLVKEDSVYVFSEEQKYRVAVNSVSYLTSDCSNFFTYGLEGTIEAANDGQILISSPYNLTLEFVQNEKLDELLFEKYQPVCADCPDSKRYQKTFARLKGFENFYFSYTREPGSDLDDTSVPQRSLIYYDGGNLIYKVNSISMDLYGCGCI